jgi:hypothetical protein
MTDNKELTSTEESEPTWGLVGIRGTRTQPLKDAVSSVVNAMGIGSDIRAEYIARESTATSMLHAFVDGAQRELRNAPPAQRERLEALFKPIADNLFEGYAMLTLRFLEDQVEIATYQEKDPKKQVDLQQRVRKAEKVAVDAIRSVSRALD